MQMKEIFHNQTTRISLFLMTIAVLLGSAPAANATAGNNNIKIVAFYGAGNLAGSEYARDTVILFNPTQAAITMNNWSLQVGGTSGSFSTVYKLPVVSIPAGGYYAIAGSGAAFQVGDCVGANCEAGFAYDYQLKTIEGTETTADNDLSSTDTIIALVDEQNPLGSGCPISSPDVVDVLGLSAADGTAQVTCRAGGGGAPYTPSKLNGVTTNIHGVVYAYGTIRKNRCIDTFSNANDFMLGYIDFENSSSTPKPCPTGNQLTVTAASTPNNPSLNGPFTITAQVTPATSPNGTVQSVTADLSNLGLSTTAKLYDDGTNGDVVAGDGTYSLATAPTAGSNGTVLGINVTATDTTGNVSQDSIPFSLGGGNIAGPGNNNIEIIAWYGAGNLSKSEYARDTVILFNPTQAPITMNKWSLQTGSTTGAFTTIYQLPTVTLPAGGYYAITGSGVAYLSSAGCVSTHCNLNYPYDYELDTIEGTNPTPVDNANHLSSTAVAVALVNSTTSLGSGCPIGSANLVDMVGIGASDGSAPVTCFAGSNYAFYTPAKLYGVTTDINGIVYAYATIRKNKCINTFDNGQDFMLGFIDFENSATPPQPCPTGNQLSVATVNVTPATVGVADPFTITANVIPATNPNSVNVNVTADLSNIGLSSSSILYDDGTHGDAKAGDHVYSLATSATSGSPGPAPGLILTATDARGDKAQNLVPLTFETGSLSMTTPTLSATVAVGGVATFPITVTSVHGYSGVLNITCSGSPNANSLGVPTSTQCVSTPPELTLAPDGSAKISVAIATGEVVLPSSTISSSLLLGLFGLLSLGALAAGLKRRKGLTTALLVAFAALLTLNTAACGKNGGLQGTTAPAGTYTYTVTATDSNFAIITSSLTFTINVQ